MFYALPSLALLFVPTILALCIRRRLLPTFLANCSVFLLGPLGTLLAVVVLATPRHVLDSVNAGLHEWKFSRQPRMWRERNCPACKQWIARTANACPHCHVRLEALDQACPGCQRPMPQTGSVCQVCGHDQKAPAT